MADKNNQELCVFIGTKAQYIKTAPLLRLFIEQGIKFRLIDSGQHAAFAPALRKELGIGEPDYVLQTGGNIRTVAQAILWLVKYTLMGLFQPSKVRNEIFANSRGICIVHGDTPTTLLSVFLAKRAGLKIAHIEAGLRSGNLFRPFPEELVRVIVMRVSDYLFAPSDLAAENLQKMKLSGRCINLDQNTNVEAMYYSLEDDAELPQIIAGLEDYCLMTIHRVETILSQRKLRYVIDLARQIAEKRPLVFIVHDPTEEKLKQFELFDVLKGIDNVTLSPLVPHTVFLKLIDGAAFVITDGGSIQEETFYLDVPCLVMRRETERDEGIDGNVVLADFDDQTIQKFIAEHASYRRGQRVECKYPSKAILEVLKADL